MNVLLILPSLDHSAAHKLREAARYRLSPSTLRESTLEQAQAFLKTVDLILIYLQESSERELAELRRIRATFSGRVLAVGPVVDPKFILQVLQNGADQYLDNNEVDAGLEAWLRRRSMSKAPVEGRLIAVLAVSGGCGASTIAVNLAAAIAKRTGSCNLVDLHPGQGDLPSLLDLRPQFTWSDLCANETRLDRAMYEKALIKHVSGVHLLCSPASYQDVRAINPRGIGQAIAIARTAFSDCVVDLQDCFHDEQVLVLRQATGILLICRLEFTALRNARRILERLRAHDIPRSRVKLVINFFGQPNELPLDEAENALGEKLAHFIPYDAKTINAANNTGNPAVIKFPLAKVSQCLLQLAQVSFGNALEISKAAGAFGMNSRNEKKEGGPVWSGK